MINIVFLNKVFDQPCYDEYIWDQPYDTALKDYTLPILNPGLKQISKLFISCDRNSILVVAFSVRSGRTTPVQIQRCHRVQRSASSLTTKKRPPKRNRKSKKLSRKKVIVLSRRCQFIWEERNIC